MTDLSSKRLKRILRREDFGSDLEELEPGGTILL